MRMYSIGTIADSTTQAVWVWELIVVLMMVQRASEIASESMHTLDRTVEMREHDHEGRQSETRGPRRSFDKDDIRDW